MALFMNKKNSQIELMELFAEFKDPMRAAIDWANSIAQQAGIDPERDQILLIREIRKANRAMNLKVATYLAGETARAS